MASPSVSLGGKVQSTLKANAGVTTLVSSRVYDRVPASTIFPYITVDMTDLVEDDDGCGKHWLCTVTVHAWSRSGNSLEARKINGAVRAALDTITAVTDYAINYSQFRQERNLDDPDGLTNHGVVVYEFALAET